MLMEFISICLLITCVAASENVNESCLNPRRSNACECIEKFKIDTYTGSKPVCSCRQSKHGLRVACRHANISEVYKVIDYISDQKIRIRILFIDSDMVTLRQNPFKNASIHYISLYCQRLAEIDNLFIGYENRLIDLSFRQCNLSKIPVETLRFLPSLKTFILSKSSNLVSITDNDFKDMRMSNELEVLHLTHNKISYIGKRAFVNLISLKRLSLEDNNIIEFKIESLHPRNNLWLLHLGYNKIIEVPDGIASKLHKRSSVHISSNSITRFSHETFQALMDKRIEVFFDDNPFHCDCKLIRSILIVRTFTNYATYLKGQLCCTSPMYLTGRFLQSLNMSDCQEQSVARSNKAQIPTVSIKLHLFATMSITVFTLVFFVYR